MRLFRSLQGRSEPKRRVVFGQIDVLDEPVNRFKLGPDEWIPTVPLRDRVAPESDVGKLPPASATDDEIYAIAARSSALKLELKIKVRNDGVYCPTCHHANKDYRRRGSPCPRCQRPLLVFNFD